MSSPHTYGCSYALVHRQSLTIGVRVGASVYKLNWMAITRHLEKEYRVELLENNEHRNGAFEDCKFC